MPEIIMSKIAGVTAKNEDGLTRQGLIKRHIHDGERLLLERERDNKYDPNAIAVYGYREVTVKKFDTEPEIKIGYIQRELASELAAKMDQGQIIHCHVANITGGEDKTIGVNIRLKVFSLEESEDLKKKPVLASQPAIVEKPKHKSLSLYVFLCLLFAVGAFGSLLTSKESGLGAILAGFAFLALAAGLYIMDRQRASKLS